MLVLLENNTLNELDEEIYELEQLVKHEENINELIELDIRKKELYLYKLQIEQERELIKEA